jgi:hypothetical protein
LIELVGHVASFSIIAIYVHPISHFVLFPFYFGRERFIRGLTGNYLRRPEKLDVEGNIWDYHKRHAGQLWNTIDERGMNPEDLPPEWSNPVYPLYRLPRPFNKLPEPSITSVEGKTVNKRKELVAQERTIVRITTRF